MTRYLRKATLTPHNSVQKVHKTCTKQYKMHQVTTS